MVRKLVHQDISEHLKLDYPLLAEAKVHPVCVLHVESTFVQLGDRVVCIEASHLLVHLEMMIMMVIMIIMMVIMIMAICLSTLRTTSLGKAIPVILHTSFTVEP